MAEQTPAKPLVLDDWIEQDLSAADLAPAFHVDDVVSQVEDVLRMGRSPVMVGQRGVGKTAVVHEIVRRAAAGARGAVGRFGHGWRL